MYAVVEIGGMQWRVAKKDSLRVPKIDTDVGKSMTFDRVLLVVDKDKVDVGKPFVKGMSVKATVVAHAKADKVKVFKKKRRKGYKVLKGHRQDYSEIRIDSIGAGKAAESTQKTEAKKDSTTKPEATKTAAPKKATQKATPAAKPASAAKPATTPKKKSDSAPAAKKTEKKASEGKKED